MNTQGRSEGFLALCRNCGKQIEFKGGKLYPWTHANADQNTCLKAEPPADYRLMTLAAIQKRFDYGSWDSADLRFLYARAELNTELLEALEEIVSAIQDGLRRHAAADPNAIKSNLISATLRQVEAAIKKARGL
jgi:hypothetical protein